MGFLEKLFGDWNEKEIRRIEKIVDKIEALDETMQALSDEELKAKTPYFKERLAKGEDILLEIDTQGALNVMKKCPDGLFIFLVPPSLAELERRIRGRGSETEESLQKRMGSACKEIEDGRKYSYVVVNDTVKHAVQRILAIRAAEHCRVDRNQEIFEELAK